jgi:hypothetical protein
MFFARCINLKCKLKLKLNFFYLPGLMVVCLGAGLVHVAWPERELHLLAQVLASGGR